MRGFPLLWGLTLFNVIKGDDLENLKEKYVWKQVDFAFPTPEDREQAINTKRFIPSNTLPLGLDVSKNSYVLYL